MEFKGTKEDWVVVEHNWSDTSIIANGKIICSFELDDIEEEDLTENDLTEEENTYNIQLIKHSKEMLELLIQLRDTEDFGIPEWKQIDNLIKQATEI